MSVLAQNLRSFGHEICIHTATPNYPEYEVYRGYKNRWFQTEEIDGIKVERSYIHVGNPDSTLHRLLSYFSFAFLSLFNSIFKSSFKPDLIICESPPLFLGKTAVILKWWKGSKLAFNVSDLWPLSVEKLGIIKAKWALKPAYWLERWIYKSSDLILGQTQGICDHISKLGFSNKTIWMPNGIKSTLEPSSVPEELEKLLVSQQKVFVYAGILGFAQGLEVIIEAAKVLEREKDLHFLILGKGPEEEKLKSKAHALGLERMHFFPPVEKEEVLAIIQRSLGVVVPLRKLELFEGAIPSKLFDALLMKKPILLGVEGEAKELFIEQGKAGLAFKPDDSKELAKACLYLSNNLDIAQTMGTNGNKFALKYFDTIKVAEKLNGEFLKREWIKDE